MIIVVDLTEKYRMGTAVDCVKAPLGILVSVVLPDTIPRLRNSLQLKAECSACASRPAVLSNRLRRFLWRDRLPWKRHVPGGQRLQRGQAQRLPGSSPRCGRQKCSSPVPDDRPIPT